MKLPDLRQPRYTPLVMILFFVLQALVVGVAFAGGVLYRDMLSAYDPATEFPLLKQAHKLVLENAYGPLPDGAGLEYGMIRGMLQALNDPFTAFYEPPQAELQANQLQGHYGGIGVRLDRDAEGYVYLYPLPDSVALKAGVLEGDRLVKVESQEITPETTLDEAQAAIRGNEGEIVKITVGRKPDYTKPLEFSIQRADAPLPSVTWNLAPGEPEVGVVQVHVMADPTAGEITGAIKDLQQRGAKFFVLDLRSNGGGYVESGVNCARLFLNSGVVIEEKYHNQPEKSYRVEKPGLFTDLPIVILVNNSTASAAEIFAGALQGQKRALLVGSPTFGKDSIQLVFDLGDGSSLHITAAHWWVPGSEQGIAGKGLQPDVLAADDAATPPLQAAIESFYSGKKP